MNNTVVSIFIENKKLLMDKRSGSKKVYANFLMCPSGHIENNESFEDAIKREMKEELNIEVKKSKYLFAIDDLDPFSKLKFRHNFILIESYTGKIKASRESKGLVWMSYEELMKIYLVNIVKDLIEKLHSTGLL